MLQLYFNVSVIKVPVVHNVTDDTGLQGILDIQAHLYVCMMIVFLYMYSSSVVQYMEKYIDIMNISVYHIEL